MSLQRIIDGDTDILECVAEGPKADWNSSWPALNQAVQEPGPKLRLDKMGLSEMAGRVEAHAGLDYDLKGRTNKGGQESKTRMSNQSV